MVIRVCLQHFHILRNLLFVSLSLSSSLRALSFYISLVKINSSAIECIVLVFVVRACMCECVFHIRVLCVSLGIMEKSSDFSPLHPPPPPSITFNLVHIAVYADSLLQRDHTTFSIHIAIAQASTHSKLPSEFNSCMKPYFDHLSISIKINLVRTV